MTKLDELEMNELVEEWKSSYDFINKRPTKQMSNKLGRYITQIVKLVINQSKFRNYSEQWRIEMESIAIYKVIKYIHNYNKEKGCKVFNYVTQVSHWAMVTEIKEQKQNKETNPYDPLFENDENLLNDMWHNINNLDRDSYEEQLEETLISFLRNNDTLENRFLVKLAQDWVEIKEHEVVRIYKLPKKKILEYIEILKKRIREMESNG